MNKEFWAGIFVLSGMAVGVGVYTTVVVETAVAEYHLYKLETNNMSGIGVGTQVLMAGYDVGKISKIDVSYDPSLTFEVEMALKPEVPIPQGSVAQLGTKLAGGGVINLVPPSYIDGFLEPGSTLSLIPSTDIQSLLESADSILKDLAIMTERGREFVEDPEQGLELRLKEVDKILIQINVLLLELTKVAKTSKGVLKDNAPLLQESLTNAEVLTTDSIELMAQMDASLKEFDVQMSAMGELMEGYDPDSNAEMKEMFESLNESSTSLQKLMNSMEKSPWRTFRKGVEE